MSTETLEHGHASAIVMSSDDSIAHELRRRGVRRVCMAGNEESFRAAVRELGDERPVVVVDAREDRVAAERLTSMAAHAFDHLSVVLWGGRSPTMQLVLSHGAERLVWCARALAPRAVIGLALLHAG